jgi:hypothetical protein
MTARVAGQNGPNEAHPRTESPLRSSAVRVSSRRDMGGATERADGASAELRPIVFMRFRPAWAYIDGIREFGQFFCATTFGVTDLADRARVVIHEALENAVKYSTNSPESELEFVIQSLGDTLEISVTSIPDAAHLSRLREELAGIHALSPEQAYLAAFLRASEEPDASSRLGLARIRYEGGVELSIHEQEGGRVRITATGKI